MQLDFPLNRGAGCLIMSAVAKKILCYGACIELIALSQHLYVFCLKVLMGVGTKDKHLVRPENSRSVNM